MLKKILIKIFSAKVHASYTVEGAFIFSITILLISFMLGTSINLYGGVKEASETPDEATELDTFQIFLGASYAGDVFNTIKDGFGISED